MPLFADNLEEAQRAYEVLEARARAAEAHAALLQTTSPLLQQRIIDLEGENVSLRFQIEEVTATKTDVALQRFFESVALAAALGEASMPDRTISSIKAEVQTYLAPDSTGIGLRFQQPELGTNADGLSTTSFEMIKVPPPQGTDAPVNICVALKQLQSLYSDPFWLRFDAAIWIVATTTTALANTDTWTGPILFRTAAALAQLQVSLSASLSGPSADQYRTAVAALSALTDSVTSKANIRAADVYNLASALAAMVAAVRTYRANA